MIFTVNKKVDLNIISEYDDPSKRFPDIDIEFTMSKVFSLTQKKNPVFDLNECAFIFNTWLNLSPFKMDLISILYGFSDELYNHINNIKDQDVSEIIKLAIIHCDNLENLMQFVFADLILMSPLNKEAIEAERQMRGDIEHFGEQNINHNKFN